MTDTSLGAVILAGGKSSRMGATKALLSLGGVTVLERVSTSLGAGGIDDIVVVTGHEPQGVRQEAERLGLRTAHNPSYELGMFTSVQTGVRALRKDIKAFFILPVDYPLVPPKVVSALLEAYGDGTGSGSVFYPSTCGRQGHPPLVHGRLRASIEAAEPDVSLRQLLDGLAPDAIRIEVEDLAIFLDMDTPDDYRLLAALAPRMDSVRIGDLGSAADQGILQPQDALHLLRSLGVPPKVVRHSETVAEVANALATALGEAGQHIDVALAGFAALLHDVAKGVPRHAEVGRRLLHGLGLGDVGDIVGCHMVLPELGRRSDSVSEAEIVYLADKLVIEDRVEGLAARTSRALEKHGGCEITTERILDRMQTATAIGRKVEQLTGFQLTEILNR